MLSNHERLRLAEIRLQLRVAAALLAAGRRMAGDSE